jgi:RNA polymerase sigma-70 factor (ECF subfamily)
MPSQDPNIAQELLSHQTFLRGLAIGLVGKDADDLVQDVWQRALERPPRHGRQLRSWLARVARNLAADRWRSEARYTELEERRASDQTAVDELELRFELRKELVGGLDSLSQSCRETILLRYFEGLAPRAIARRQGVPEATVKTRLRRGLAQLREALDKRYDGDRRAWMSAVTALAAPVGSGVAPGTLVIGGMAMGTMMKVSAAALVVAACVYFVARAPEAESPRKTAVEPAATEVELPEPTGAGIVSPVEGQATEAGGRSPVAEEPSVDVAAARGSKVLRVVLEGITEEEALITTVTLTGVDKRTFDRRLATAEQWRAYVQWVQSALNRVLETRLEVDGRVGPRLHRAIAAFQEREGLPTTGRGDPKTEAALIRCDDTPSYAPQWPVEIRESWPCQGSTSEFELDPFFAAVAEREVDLRVDELEVSVDHPLHLIETTRVPLSRAVERKSGQTVYVVRVRPVSAAAIHGRLVRENGTPAAEGLVGALLLEEDFPIEDEGRAVECAADGGFEFRVPASGRYALASYEYGRRPTTTRVEALLGTRVDVGTILIEPGNTISGSVQCRGNPVAGAFVSVKSPTYKTAASPDAVKSGMQTSVSERRSFHAPGRSVDFLWLNRATTFSTLSGNGSRRDGRFELARGRQWRETDENGAFDFTGLGTGDYLLSVEGLAESRTAPSLFGDRPEGMVSINGSTPGLVFSAPEHGVVLDFRWTSIRFELEGDLEREGEGRLLLKTPSARPTSSLPPDERGTNVVFDFQSSVYPLSGNESTYVLQALPGKHMTGEVTFPGRQTVPLDFWTPESCEEVVVPIQLVRGGEVATLVIELENPQAKIPDTFTVKLLRAGALPEARQVEAREGQVRVEGILPGAYRVQVRPGEDRYFASGLCFANEFEVELRPGLEVTRSILLRGGAGMRVTVHGEDGDLVSGQYEFFDDAGRPVGLVLGTDLTDTSDGSISSWTFDSYPIHTSLNPFEPGRYRLVLRSPGYAERSVTVELRAGEYEDIDVTLFR